MRLKSQEKKISILRRIKLYKYYSYVNRLLAIPTEEADCFNIDFAGEKLDLITIAFNNIYVLKHQIRKIKENIKDSGFTYIIADNSTNTKKRQEIKKICVKENIPYIGIPQPQKNKAIGGSTSHSAALNWIYYNLLKKRNPEWFGFLDHDIYPLKPINLIEKFGEQPFWGKKDGRKNYWYIWPGFAFFNMKYLYDVKVDFSPAKINDTYVDTGGALWFDLYSKLNAENFNFPSNKIVSLKELGYDYSDLVEFFGEEEWFHSMNASLWKQASDYSNAIDNILSK